jgi:hypothetical protein
VTDTLSAATTARRLWGQVSGLSGRANPGICLALLAMFAASPRAHAYSVLSHEAIVDTAWDTSVKPALLKRFPGSAENDLRKAHAYSYGGAIIQDMGYYPFGSHLFTDLTHYVRSGDFIVNLIGGARELNEYAFALGALAHYAADNIGHDSVNKSAPMLYPKVRAKFGPVATYEDSPAAHLKTEFSFDVEEVADHRYAPDAYHDFIGFEVSKPALERAFEQTYGIPLKDISRSLDLALGTYRRTVSKLLPAVTKVAWQAKQKDLMQADPGLSKRRFVYVLSRASYEKEWDGNYQKPGLWARFLAFLLRIVPKIGPFRALAFQAPTPATQKLFMDDFVRAVEFYRGRLTEVQADGKPRLENRNFDTGYPSRFGEYWRADDACDKLLIRLSEKKFKGSDDNLRNAIVAFYGKDVPADRKGAAALEALRAAH